MITGMRAGKPVEGSSSWSSLPYSCARNDGKIRVDSRIKIKNRVFYIGPLNFATVLIATLSFSSCSILPNATSIFSEIHLATISVHSNVTYSAGPLRSSILTFAAHPRYSAQPPLFLPMRDWQPPDPNSPSLLA
jgi:hypothetical protein